MMRDIPPLDALELISTVARLGSISAASRELGLTQQSASARVRSVERTLGVEIVTRSPSGIALTEAGKLVVAWADELLSVARRFRAGVEALRGQRSRELIVAASQTVATELAPRWVLALRSRQLAEDVIPTQVRLLAANSEQAANLVRTGRADLGIIETPDVPTDLSSSVIARDELVLIAGGSHPWTMRERIAVEDAADMPLIAREDGSGTRLAWESIVQRRLGRAPADPAVVLSSTAAVRSAVADGIAPAVVSALVVADDVALGRIHRIRIDGDPLTRPITAIWRGGERDLLPTSRDLLAAASVRE